MASVKSTSAVNRERTQGISPVAGSQGDAPADLVAEFSQLVEQIAGQFAVSPEMGFLDGVKPAAAPTRVEASRDGRGAAREDTPKDALAQSGTAADKPASSGSEEKNDEAQAAPTDADTEEVSTPSEEDAPQAGAASATDSADTSKPSEVAVAVAAASMQSAEAAMEKEPSTEMVLADEAVEGLPTEAPTAEVLNDQNAPHEQQAADAAATEVAAVPTELTTAAASFEDSKEVVNEIPSLHPAAAESHAAKAALPEAAQAVAATPVEARSSDLGAASDESLRYASSLQNLSSHASEALDRVLQQAANNSVNLVQPAMRSALDRDALVASLALRPVLEQATRATETLRPAGVAAQNNAIDAAALKPMSKASTDVGARAPRPTARVSFEAALEKIETVAREAAKARDGSSLTFRLDPPQLGSLKVDISLRDGNLHARLIPESQQVAQMLRERAHELQQNLKKLGLEVDSVSVSVGGDQSSSGAGTQGEAAFSHDGQPKGARAESVMRGSVNPAGMTGAPAMSLSTVVEDHWVA